MLAAMLSVLVLGNLVVAAWFSLRKKPPPTPSPLRSDPNVDAELGILQQVQ